MKSIWLHSSHATILPITPSPWVVIEYQLTSTNSFLYKLPRVFTLITLVSMKTVFTFTKPIFVANTRTTSVRITVARDTFIGFNIAKVAVFTIFAFRAGVSCNVD